MFQDQNRETIGPSRSLWLRAWQDCVSQHNTRPARWRPRPIFWSQTGPVLRPTVSDHITASQSYLSLYCRTLSNVFCPRLCHAGNVCTQPITNAASHSVDCLITRRNMCGVHAQLRSVGAVSGLTVMMTHVWPTCPVWPWTGQPGSVLRHSTTCSTTTPACDALMA